jgi:Na+-driven multidrug efflux pump
VQEFTRILIVSLPALIAQEVLRKFLLAQGLMAPLLYCGALAFLLHVPCCYALVKLDVLGIGAVRGGAVSLVLSYYLGDALVLAHTLCRGLHRKTFHGWTWEALQLSQVLLLPSPRRFDRF